MDVFFYFTQVPQTSKSKAQPPFLTTYGSFFRMGGSSIFVKKEIEQRNFVFTHTLSFWYSHMCFSKFQQLLPKWNIPFERWRHLETSIPLVSKLHNSPRKSVNGCSTLSISAHVESRSKIKGCIYNPKSVHPRRKLEWSILQVMTVDFHRYEWP